MIAWSKEVGVIGIRVVLLALLGSLMAPAQAIEALVWREVPVSIVLKVGEERVLAFPDHVQVGVPAALTPDLFRTQSTGGTVLWLARQPFERQRIQVRLVNTGHVMLFDVTAVDGGSGGSAEPIQVTFPDTREDPSAAESERVNPVALTRFAAQQLYAPQRVLREQPEIRRVPMGIAASISLYRDPQVIAEPLGSWQGGGLYVTAVKLTNLRATRVSLDPRRLRGHFIAATFQHNTLGPAHARSDTTCAYLVTDRPFIASIVALGADATELTEGED